MQTVLVLDHDQMGSGDPDLGARILKTFLQKAVALQDLDAILMFNLGVKLTAADSPVLQELGMLDERGVELVPCGTCLQHYGVEPAVGAVASMDDIVSAMGKAQKVITL